MVNFHKTCKNSEKINRMAGILLTNHGILKIQKVAKGVKPMANVFNVAKYILSKTGHVSTMKLQKLCYYSQAWSLVWDDRPLFPEEFEAWANGPVCRRLFDVHRGQFSINEDDIPGNLLGDALCTTQKDTIDAVLEHYGSKDAQWLSTLTHMEDPWKNARHGYAPGMSCEETISKASMAEYYGSL